MKLFSRRKFPNRLGMPLLGIWLVAWGILALHLLNIPRSDVIAGWVMPLLAIAAGVLILMER
ncbi:MAG TPA: hypothetical protein VG013_02700 [Gemmataceae bacterium]|jgi:hypothetical protein|nr:hypothetical protein [Gemmataceae bacterium]